MIDEPEKSGQDYGHRCEHAGDLGVGTAEVF